MTTREDIDMLTRRINKCMGETREFYHVINGNCRWHLRDESGREYFSTRTKNDMVQLLSALLMGMDLGLSRANVNSGWPTVFKT
jgi:hypothetical protein